MFREKLFENIEKAPLKIPSILTEPAKSLLKGVILISHNKIH